MKQPSSYSEPKQASTLELGERFVVRGIEDSPEGLEAFRSTIERLTMIYMIKAGMAQDANEWVRDYAGSFDLMIRGTLLTPDKMDWHLIRNKAEEFIGQVRAKLKDTF